MSTFHLDYPRKANGTWRGSVATALALPSNPLDGDTYVILDTSVLTYWDASAITWKTITAAGVFGVADTTTVNLTDTAGTITADVIPGGISHTAIADIGTNTHSDIDTHIGIGITNTHSDIDTHIGDGTIHYTVGSISHTAITDIGTTTHSDIDSHIGDGTLHFTVGSISHTSITDIGTTTHSDIDSHIGDGTLHYTVGSISHTSITDIGTTTHADIDLHIGNAAIHSPVGITVADTTSVDLSLSVLGELTADVDPSGISHTAITDIGTTSHADIDSHIGDGTIHFLVGDISHTSITDIGTTSHADIDSHIGDSTIHFLVGDISHTSITDIGTTSHADIDSHIGDSTIHFLVGDISHTAITDIGTTSHADIDSHIGDGTIHFTESAIDHDNILNNGSNSHSDIDNHIADVEVHQLNPSTQYIFTEDFVSYTNSSNQLTTGVVATGSVVVCADSDYSSFLNTCVGAVVQKVTDETTVDKAYIRQGTSTGAGANQIPINSGDIVYQTRVAVNALSNGTDDYRFICGLFDASIYSSIDNGFWFELGSDTTNNYIKCYNMSGGSATYHTSTVAPVVNTFINLKIVKTSTNIKFYIDDVLKFTHTTNIPSVNCHLEHNLQKMNGVNTQIKVWTDYIQLKIKFTSR